MQPTRFVQLDVFAEKPGGGNPLGVVFGADAWSAEQMQAFAAWTNLVETTFVVPARDAAADYRLRIFTPQREIGFAGHPTVGSAHAAMHCAVLAGERLQLVQECGAGLVPIRAEDDGHVRRWFVQAPAIRVLDAPAPSRASAQQILHGLLPGALGVVLVEGGRRWWLAELADEAALRAWQPPHVQIAALAHASDSLGLCVYARSASSEYELVVRAFPAGVGIVEDPASGAANGLIAAFIAVQEPNGPLARGYRVSQGREIGRDASITIRIESGRAWVGGRSHVVIDGALQWPAGGG